MNAVVLETIRRRRYAVAMFLLIDLMRRNSERKLKRRIWSRPWLLRRNMSQSVLTMLFEELGPEDPASFSNYTRIKEDVLNDLLLLITPYIQKQNTVMREAISPRDRFSATLRYLATGNTFQDLAYSTRIAPNTLSQIINETVETIIKVLEEKVMVFPSTPEEWEFIADKYQSNWQFPHCIGALDGKHIVFQPPRKEGSIYRNYKGQNSIVLLALVDAEYKFIFVDIGRNGRMHDSAVFRDSCLGVKLNAESLNLPMPNSLPGFSHRMPYVIVGDDAFPLKQNLMKPYPNRRLTIEKRIFNYRLSRARRVVENAFGILANRFRVLLNPILLSVEKVEAITYACVLLHNFLLSKKCQWYVSSEYRNPETFLDSGLVSISQQCGNRCTDTARVVRDNFAEYFNTAGVVNWQYDAIAKGNV
ncbi:uncharacterized protein [Temnothorax longispinosus]|uniref:uncharacterized protein isoform X1 n=1 Tax=Temnothorax longispinosus TaxID=300112 RepID=UPI003A99B6E3